MRAPRAIPGGGRFRIVPNPPIAGRPAEVTYIGPATEVEYQVDGQPPVTVRPDRDGKFTIDPIPPKKLTQQEAADALGIRQATLSQIERGNSMPTCALLVQLCKFYDVTPTYLLDEGHGLEPREPDRWGLRNALVTVGMWIEAPRGSLVKSRDGKMLCPLLPGESFFDQEAFEERRRTANKGELARAMKALRERKRRTEKAAVEALDGELQMHPRRRPRHDG